MFEHPNELNAVVVVLSAASVMVLAGMAKKQLIWRPRRHRRVHCVTAGVRRRRRR